MLELSVWVPGQSSQRYIGNSATSYWTAMIDGRVGVSDCYGAHLRWPDGSYKRWQFMGCVS